MKYIVSQIKKDVKTDPRAFEAMIEGNVDPVFFLTSYEEVCEIEADSLDEVFEIGNIGPDEKIRRFDFAPMHSISVGDVIMTETYELYVVKGLGFERLPMSSPNGRQWTADEVYA
jgi:hypothetical protein